MARIRTIKPEFWSSEQVMECSPIARLLFIGLWNFCDDAGNHVDSDKTIKAEVFPGDDISSSDVRRMIDELSSNGLVVRYTSENKGFLHVTGWKHQKIERPSYKHPPFQAEASPNDRRTIGELSPPGREGKGREKEESSLRSDSSSPSAEDPPADLLTQPPPGPRKASKAERIQQIAEEAQAAYNAALGKPNGLLPACALLNGPRLKAVEKSLPTVRAMCRNLYGSERIPPEFWAEYFGEVATDPWHSGRIRGGPGHENWKPDFEYLLREGVMAKLFDRAMSEAA